MSRLRSCCAGLLAATLLLAGPTLAAEARRVVAADGAVTEIVYALGAEAQLVGVDSTSRYPTTARQLPQVGYRRTLTAEGILSLRPTAIIASDEAGPAQTLARLSAAGVAVHRLPPVQRPADLLTRVERIGQWLNRPQAAEQLNARLRAQLHSVQAALPLRRPPKVLFLLAAGGHGVMVAGQGTQAQVLLDALGLPNAAAGQRGYKPLSAEALLALAPEAVVVAEAEPGRFRPEAWPSLQLTPAGRSRRLLVADSMYLLGFGPRLPAALHDVLAAVTPETPR